MIQWAAGKPILSSGLIFSAERPSLSNFINLPMSALGQKQTFAMRTGVSVLAPVATAKANSPAKTPFSMCSGVAKGQCQFSVLRGSLFCE